MTASIPKLIVNADDYGRSPAISQGIREAHLKGIVSSTTVMANFENTQQDVQQALEECPQLQMGVHLNITAGLPLAPSQQVPDLITPDGNFKSNADHLASLETLKINQVEIEWRLQIEALLQIGVRIDHLDSHHHMAAVHSELWSLHLALAKEYNLGVRLPYPTDDDESLLVAQFPPQLRRFASDVAPVKMLAANLPHTQALFMSFFGQSATLDTFLGLLEEATAYSSSEIMCHPGHVDAEGTESSYASQRPVELEILTSPEVTSALKSLDLELTGYDDL